ncbi:hypothetical protein [Roseovarius sp. D0-M9]|uniref:hypothetical protein n=1 Tax=Roseovarius sp. D0-M9 TaxID=3127117 RepID=UPI00300FEEB8
MELTMTSYNSDDEAQINPIWFVNKGRFMTATNYWSSSFAQRGLCYLSGSAGHLQFLIPECHEEALREFQAVQQATIEPSIHADGHIDVVAQDGTTRPYFVSIDKRILDVRIVAKRCRLLVYSNHGLIKNMPVRIRA